MKKNSILLILIFSYVICIAQINYEQYFTDKVLRIDYERIGNLLTDSISVTDFKTEQLWSGLRSKTIDPFDYGNYKIHIKIPEKDSTLFTYTYSSLFAEYIYTDIGSSEIKSFQETVRIPFPKKDVELIFYNRNYKNEWTEQFFMKIVPDSIKFSITKTEKIEYRKIFDSGKPENKVDIAFVSEGYSTDMKEKFFNDAQRISNYLLKCKPFLKHRDKINIWSVYAPSVDNGVSDPSTGLELNTVLSGNFCTFGLDRYLMTENVFKLRDIVSVVPYDHIVIIVNTDEYGGGGIYNYYAVCPADNILTDFLVIHEIGHSLACLADEYYENESPYSEMYNLTVEPYEDNITTLVNFEIKWKNMITKNTPVPTPDIRKYRNKIGVFEGAGYSEKGIYRPFYNCSMKSAIYDYFCPVCIKTIEKMIYYYSE